MSRDNTPALGRKADSTLHCLYYYYKKANNNFTNDDLFKYLFLLIILFLSGVLKTKTKPHKMVIVINEGPKQIEATSPLRS